MRSHSSPARPLSVYIVLAGLMSIILAGALTGCGVKPSTLSAPPGAEDEVFPRTYPDTGTDAQK